jgi:hypothetical protein
MFIDHMKLVGRQPREMKRLRRYLLGLQEGEEDPLEVEHEADDSCCRREAWPVTMQKIVEALDLPTLFIPPYHGEKT